MANGALGGGAARKRILFVDDEPAILSGLQNLLYKDRKRWEMVFAGGGDHALAELEKQPFDVVVSDMRMPGVDGAMLLNAIKARHPATARIMLSGHAEREAIVRALPALHQLLAKPCDAAMLRGAIERGLDLSARDAACRAIIGCVDKLPSAPAVHAELIDALAAMRTRLEDVEAIVKRDPGLAAKVLQLVNSAYFGAGQTIATIAHAVRMLGLDRLRSMTTVFAAAETRAREVTALQLHAVRTARLASQLVPEHAEAAYAAALLHDVGQIVLAGIENVEQAEAGACLLSVWGVPKSLVEIVRHQHAPDAAAPDHRLIAAAVFVAEAAVHDRPLDHAVVERCGLADRLAGWTALADAARIP